MARSYRVLTVSLRGLRLASCSTELDSLGRPTRSLGYSDRAERQAQPARGLSEHKRPPHGEVLESKLLEVGGFDTRRTYHYCIVRLDLPRGAQFAQLIHAAGEGSPRVLPGTYAIALGARDEGHLEALALELLERGIEFVEVREPDAPYCGALMALGLEPTKDRRAIQKVTGQLPLLR